jgi:hypothetical protein
VTLPCSPSVEHDAAAADTQHAGPPQLACNCASLPAVALKNSTSRKSAERWETHPEGTVLTRSATTERTIIGRRLLTDMWPTVAATASCLHRAMVAACTISSTSAQGLLLKKLSLQQSRWSAGQHAPDGVHPNCRVWEGSEHVCNTLKLIEVTAARSLHRTAAGQLRTAKKGVRNRWCWYALTGALRAASTAHPPRRMQKFKDGD